MQPLEQLIAEAEVQRVLQICNACRYCEGFCAVFPAMARRLEFPAAEVHDLASLCHNCGACLHACQYAPPHAFAVNVPQAMARVRVKTYADHAWPQALGALYKHNGLTLAVALVAALTLFLVLGAAATGSLWTRVDGGFYAIFPHGWMVGLFAPVFAFAVLALGIGATRFWRAAPPGPPSAAAVGEAVHDALTLKYLDGGHGEGCHNDDDAWTQARRRAHHLVFYGFLLCFAATSVATLYHYGLGWAAPYPLAVTATGLPKLLGTTGGLMLCGGCVWLWRLRARRHPQHLEATQAAMDKGFVALLFLTAASGLLLALLRASPALPLALCLHLGAVMALFLTLPYGKFAHGIYRAAALLKWAIEKRRPSALRLGSE